MTAVLPDLTDRPDATAATLPIGLPRLGSSFPASHSCSESQACIAGGDINHLDAYAHPFPNDRSRPGSNSLVGQTRTATQPVVAGEGTIIRSDQRLSGTHRCFVAAEQTHPNEAIVQSAASECSPRSGDILADPTVGFLAQVLDDLEKVRIANTNRLAQLTRPVGELDKDGEGRGWGLDESNPNVAQLMEIVRQLANAETVATKSLEKAVRQHPLGKWAKKQRGLGDKQVGRLLSAVGDPAWNDLHNRPRTVSELWAYCGLHVINGGAARRVKKQRANWSNAAKMRAYLCAESCMKQVDRECKMTRMDPTDSSEPVQHLAGCKCGTYRKLYDEGRAKYAGAVHHGECLPCGPKGKPAPGGSPLSKNHQKARALRLVAKAILRDLWREARRVHGWDEEQAAA